MQQKRNAIRAILERLFVNSKRIRVRFAPSPTGTMHIGNIRIAVLNYLFAKQNGGTFIVRIEDTDPERNFDPGAKAIIADLNWLDLHYDEGPEKDGPHAPYFQSQRTAIYNEKLEELKQKQLVYPCFCSEQELQKKRERHVTLKIPPRYDRTCMQLSPEVASTRVQQKEPHVWRFMMDENHTVTITDLSRGIITFELKNFSDFPLTRADGSFTFIFANFVDDMLMEISHVFRGEDHLSNTAWQAALYHAFGATQPIFWHLPIVCNVEGKKLSKRDFGFSLRDMQSEGFLPQAIVNYLAIIGGSYAHEIMNLDELAHAFNFKHAHATSTIKYDVEKLRWINHKWINRLSSQELLRHTRPFLERIYPQACNMSDTQLIPMLQAIKNDLFTLVDATRILQFYFNMPEIAVSSVLACATQKQVHSIGLFLKEHTSLLSLPDEFLKALKISAKVHSIPMESVFCILRITLTGQPHGPQIRDVISLLGHQESERRIQNMLNVLSV